MIAERAPVSVPQPTPTLPVTDGMAAVALSAAPPIAPAPVSAPAPEALVRRTIDDYVAAYNRLDARAAQRVWPNVDRAALARAFADLASQRVTLSGCQISVAADAARAACNGTTTWTPKIGGGGRTDERSWTFALARSGANWQIVSARVQNR